MPMPNSGLMCRRWRDERDIQEAYRGTSGRAGRKGSAEHIQLHPGHDGRERRCGMKKAEYLRKILKVIADIDSVWVLEQIYRFAVNMTRD